MRLNTLGASPSFAAWLQGPPLEVRDLLATPDGRPRASVISIAHLPDAQRQAVVSLVLGRLITWMRAAGASAAWPAAAARRRGPHSGGGGRAARRARDRRAGRARGPPRRTLTEIDERWREVAAQVEEVDVGLERDDIDVTGVALVWVRRDA